MKLHHDHDTSHAECCGVFRLTTFNDAGETVASREYPVEVVFAMYLTHQAIKRHEVDPSDPILHALRKRYAVQLKMYRGEGRYPERHRGNPYHEGLKKPSAPFSHSHYRSEDPKALIYLMKIDTDKNY